jgi:hypothetical protein
VALLVAIVAHFVLNARLWTLAPFTVVIILVAVVVAFVVVLVLVILVFVVSVTSAVSASVTAIAASITFGRVLFLPLCKIIG